MTDILDQDPPSGTVPFQAVEFFDDGSEPLGTVTEIIGGSNSRGISRQEFLVIDPRLTDDAISTGGNFGSAASRYSAGIAQNADPNSPISSAQTYTIGHLKQFKSAVNELANDSTIKALAHHEATLGLSSAQLLGQVIKSGIGAGIISDAFEVANTVGLSSGAGVVSTEVGALSLTLGAISQDFAHLTGSQFSPAHVENNIVQLFTAFVNRSIQHSS